jgi:cysteine desulfuration protein SufE
MGGMTLADKKRELLERLSRIRDAQERFAYVVDCGRRQTPLPESCKTEEFRVEGCLAKLWLVPSFKEGKCFFETDSDSAIMKGIAVMLCEFYSGQTPAEIAATDPSFLREVGITQHLTPNRRNGLARIWERIRTFATTQQGSLPSSADKVS